MIEINVKPSTHVQLRWCSQAALDSLGMLDTLRVDGDLNFYTCRGLTGLSDDINVKGTLNLSFCTGLTELPDGLTVKWGLALFGCKGITKLPEDLQVEGVIYYNEGTGFYGHMDEPGVIPNHLKNKLKKF
jgi:hypothetical protein